MKHYKIKYKGKSYLVKAQDAKSAIDALAFVAPNTVDDERLSPMTYKKLKEMGYGHEDWKDLSQEQANKIVQKHMYATTGFDPESDGYFQNQGEKPSEEQLVKLRKQWREEAVGEQSGEKSSEQKTPGKTGNNLVKSTISSREQQTIDRYDNDLVETHKVNIDDLPKPDKALTVKGGETLWGMIRGNTDISIDDIVNHPLVRATQEKLRKNFGGMITENINGKDMIVGENETIRIQTPERNELRNKIADKIASQGSIVKTVDENGKKHTTYSGPVAKNHRAEIVIGVPAGGKSSVIVDKVSSKTQSRVLDSDDVKKELPEFDNGNGAGLVHKESADDILTNRIIPQFMKGGKHNGENIVIPIVGKNPKAALNYLKQLKEAGYDVHLSFNDVSAENSAKRATTRFLEEGRFLDPGYIQSIGSKPQETYEKLKEGVDGLHFDSYARYNNNVAFGQPAEKVEKVDYKGNNLDWEAWQ